MRSVKEIRQRVNTPFSLLTSEDMYYLFRVMDEMLEVINQLEYYRASEYTSEEDAHKYTFEDFEKKKGDT